MPCLHMPSRFAALESAAKMQNDTIQFENVAAVGLAEMIGLPNIRIRTLRVAGIVVQPENPS